MTVFEAVRDVMHDVQGLGKKGRNNQSGYNFRGIDDVMNAVGPALREHGVIVAPEVIDERYSQVEVGKNRTVMSHVSLRIKWHWFGPEGDTFECVTQGEAFDSGDKATAKAHSVAYRTCLLQTLCLPTNEPDPDANTYERSPAPDKDEVAKFIAAAQSVEELNSRHREIVVAGLAESGKARANELRAVSNG